jgi:hypothetical protein
MTIKKLLLKPGVNRENTRYTNEGGWYESDKVRFRQGTPEKIGGWVRISTGYFQGICRSLWNWVTLANQNLLGVGTNLKFYIEQGGAYYDVTPIRATVVLNNPFTAVTISPFSSTITVSATAHGAITNDFVTFSGAASLGGNITAAVLNQEYKITVVDINTYSFTARDTSNVTVTSNASDTGHGGATVSAQYQINTGPETQVPLIGWGAGKWGYGTWGGGEAVAVSLRIWTQSNFGEDLVFAPRGGAIYYWIAASGVTTRGVLVSSLSGASDVPTVQNLIYVSDTSRFVFAFGANDYGSAVQDPMLVRWSDQESVTQWTPATTNQAGSVRLSHGSKIVTAIQTRQEIVVLTDASVYSFQYVGPPAVWQTQLLGDNISIIGPNAIAQASGIVYWMGVDKFYFYDGRVQTLNSDLRKFVYQDINLTQNEQCFASTNEGFNEVWFFYCSTSSTTIDKYVVYNYVEKNPAGGVGIWYYGTLGRTAWLDSGLRNYPLAATYTYNIVNQEYGNDDAETGTSAAIEAYISSCEFDIDDGDKFGFMWRVLPDLTFSGSESTTTPEVTFTFYPMQNSGSGTGTAVAKAVSEITAASYTVTPEFTGQINTRVRGRQLIMKVGSTNLGTAWQLGAPRIDIRPDGRR